MAPEEPLPEAAIVPETDNESSGKQEANATFPVVAIGASAGGLEAFTSVLRRLPADTGMAFVLIQHPKSALSRWEPTAVSPITPASEPRRSI